MILQTGRDLYRGAICIISAGDVKEALIEAVREPAAERPVGSRCRYWRYLPKGGRNDPKRVGGAAELGEATERRKLIAPRALLF